MPDGILSFEQGEVRLSGEAVPGIFKSLSISGLVRFDKAEQDGLSGKTKTPLGWEDADIYIELELLSEDGSDCYQKLSRLSVIFKGHDNGGNPKVYDVVNAHVRARGIDQVVFSGLDSSETDEDDVMVATLSFVEHNPPVTVKEKQVVVSDAAKGGTATPETSGTAGTDSDIMEDPGPFESGYGVWQ